MTAGRAHCGRWVKADPAKHSARRLVCTKPAEHGGYHVHGPSGWMWVAQRPWPALVPDRPYRAEIVREWSCRGWVPELQGLCGRTYVATEDGARAKGWRIQLGGLRDQLCPQCGRPDPETVRLVRDIERSIAR